MVLPSRVAARSQGLPSALSIRGYGETDENPYAVCPYAVKDGNLTFSLDGHEVSTGNGRLSLHALDRLVIIYLMTPTAPGNKSEFPAGFVGVTPEVVGEQTVVAKANVLSRTSDPTDARCCEVLVDADISAADVVGLLVENATLNPNVTIHGNRFEDYPNLRLSGRGTYLIESNRFECCCSAVTGMDLADYWYESGRIANMTIRNNVVVNGTGFIFGLTGWRGNEPNLPKIRGRIVLRGNTFEAMRREKWSAVGVREFVVSEDQ